MAKYVYGGVFISFEVAKAGDVASEFQKVQTATTAEEIRTDDSIKFPAGEGNDIRITENSAQRASKILGFDVNGDLKVKTAVEAGVATDLLESVADVVHDVGVSGQTWTASNTKIDTVSVGEVLAGDIVFVNIRITGTKGATGGAVNTFIHPGSASVALGNPTLSINRHTTILRPVASELFSVNDVAIFHVSADGELIFDMYAQSIGSNSTSCEYEISTFITRKV